MTNPPITRDPVWGVFFFGSILGGLVAFTTTAGITATVIGLIFTLVGGSFLAWFQPDKVTQEQRQALLRYMGFLALGLWAGLLFGFLLRGIEDAWIRPAIVEIWQNKFHINPDEAKGPDAVAQVKLPRPIFQAQANIQDFAQARNALIDDQKDEKLKLSKEDLEVLANITE